MNVLRNLSIRRKVVATMFLATLSTVLIGAAVLIGWELATYRGEALRELTALAKVVGTSSAGAVVFADQQSASDILSRLSDDPSIVSARLYTDDGAPLASFLRQGENNAVLSDRPQEPGHVFGNGRLTVHLAIQHRGDVVGHLSISYDLASVRARLMGYLSIILALVALLIGFSFIISTVLQRFVSAPILRLAEVAKRITERQDYFVRAEGSGDDEVGTLTRAFNQMLETIQNREMELEKSRASLIEQAEALWRSNRELEQFAYVSSHDLQEPLRKVASYAHLIESKYRNKLDADAEHYITNITDGAARMRDLIQDLLAYSRLGRETPPTEAVDLNDIMRRLVEDLETSIKEAGAQVVVDSPLPVIQGRPSQMQQLFQNLVSNALKFRGQKPPVVRISGTRRGDVHVFSVQDNGIGIESGYTKQIFKVFQRLHPRTSYPGTGIGLAICKKIVEQHGGKIWVESVPGQGSNFLFSIPLVQKEEFAGRGIPSDGEHALT